MAEDANFEFVEAETPLPFAAMADMSTGDDIVDAEIVDEGESDTPSANERTRRSRTRRVSAGSTGEAPPGNPRTPREAKSGPPSLDEWQGFFSRVVLRVIVEWYLTVAFRGIDEDALSEKEVDKLALSDDERALIAVPFSELAHKSKFMRKHGRTIVASGDAVNAVIVLAAWASRVNRIAAKYRPRQPRSRTVINNGSSGQGTPEANGETTGATGGRIPNGAFTIFPGSG